MRKRTRERKQERKMEKPTAKKMTPTLPGKSKVAPMGRKKRGETYGG